MLSQGGNELRGQVLDILIPKMEAAVKLLNAQKEVDFTDGGAWQTLLATPSDAFRSLVSRIMPSDVASNACQAPLFLESNGIH